MRKDSVIVIHLSSARSVRGKFRRRTRLFTEITKFEIEADGTFFASDNQTCLVPNSLIELIEVA